MFLPRVQIHGCFGRRVVFTFCDEFGQSLNAEVSVVCAECYDRFRFCFFLDFVDFVEDICICVVPMFYAECGG